MIDEVTLPMSRWRVIRDEPTFAAVVEEVRKGQLNTREDTEVQGHTQTQTETYTHTRTATQTLTQTATETHSITVEIEDAGANPDSILSPIDSTPIDSSRVQDAEFVDVADDSVEVSRGSWKEPVKVRQYGVFDTSTYESSSSGFNFKALMWSIAIVVSLIALWLFLNSAQIQEAPKPSYNANDYARILNEAREAWRGGDFLKALSFYRQADTINPRQPEVVSRLAPLLVHLEAQNVAAKRAIRETISGLKSGDPSLRAELELALSLAALAGDEFNEAETHCRTARSLSPAWKAARFTCGTVFYQKKQYAEAAKNFEETGDEAAALLMNARSLIAANKYGRSPERKRAEAIIAKLVQQHHDFLQEGLVMAAFLELESGDKRAAMQRAREALDIDPDLTNDHWHDPFMYLEPLGWRSLVPFCRRLASEARSPTTRALLGLCLYKASHRTEAGEVIADAVAQTSGPGVQLLQSVNAYIMMSSGRLEDARAALKIALRDDPPALAVLLRARVCARLNDMSCAEQAWLDLDDGKGRNLPALIGLAGFRLLKGDRLGAMSYAEKARRISPTYLPARLFEEVGSTR